VLFKFEDMQGFGFGGFEAAKAATESTTKGFQAILSEATDYSKKSLESNQAFVERLLQARNPQEIVEAQTNFAKAAYNDFVANATKMGRLYSDLSKEAFEGLTDGASKAVKDASSVPSSVAKSSWKAPVAASKAPVAEKQD